MDVNTVERLTLLREALVIAKEHEAKLDMGEWVKLIGVDSQVIAEDISSAAACGTVCCNAGWAGLYAPIRELGLVTTLGSACGRNEKLELDGDAVDYTGYNSLASLFGISEKESFLLFADDVKTNDDRNNVIPDILEYDGEFDEYEDMTLDKSIALLDVIITRY